MTNVRFIHRWQTLFALFLGIRPNICHVNVGFRYTMSKYKIFRQKTLNVSYYIKVSMRDINQWNIILCQMLTNYNIMHHNRYFRFPAEWFYNDVYRFYFL